MNVDRCCNCTGNGGYPCDEDPPVCLLVTIAGFEPSECERPDISASMWVPELATGVPLDRPHSVEGINGSHIVGDGLSWSDNFFCMVRGEHDASGVTHIGIVYERFTITISLTCTDGVDFFDEWHVVGAEVSSEQIGGVGSFDGVLFQYSGDPVPFGTVLESSISSVCEDVVLPNNATLIVTPIECPAGHPSTNYYAISCDDPDDQITVDVSGRPINHQYCLYNSVKYRLTGQRSNETPVAVTWEDLRCTPAEWPVCYRCDGQAGTITIDPAAIPGGTQTVRYNSVLYFISSKHSTQSPVTVEALTTPCPQSPYRIARKCSGAPGEITYDPASADPGSLTMIYMGERYYPTVITSNDPPVTVIWSQSGCNTAGPGPTNPCNDPACQFGSPNWPSCCDAPWYADCPDCAAALTSQHQPIAQVRSRAGSAAGLKNVKNTGPRKRGLISEEELDAMGHDPEQEARALKRGGCCDPPRE